MLEDNILPEYVAGRERYDLNRLSTVPFAGTREGMSDQETRILVCDDDELLLELLQHRLSSKGYSVELARDGREALEKIRADPPDAIVLDAMMPLVDGYEVLRQFRAMDGMAEVPVIFLTARKQEQDIVEALSLGASDYLAKPFIPEELVARLARLITKAS